MFCPCVLCVTVIGLYLLCIMWRQCFFSYLENFEENFGIPRLPPCLLPSISKNSLEHFGVIIKNLFMTPAVIFLINNWNFHSDVCNGSCSFLHAPPSEVQNKMIFMRYQILSCHVPVSRSFFIWCKMLLSS
jgi:hypothetical protein